MGTSIGDVLSIPVPWRSRSRPNEHRFAPPERWIGRRAELIRELLRHNDGYSWVDEIAQTMGWSLAFTERTLAEMEAADAIVRYRFNRRELVCLEKTTAERPHLVGRGLPGL